jgi:hypothetical protein
VRLPPEFSPCRTHPCSVEHADVVRDFWDAQRSWHERAEAETNGYEAEMKRFVEDNPQPTFKEFLRARRSNP